MTQTVEIRRLLPGGRCEVFVRRESACGHSCESCGGCGANGAVTATARNAVSAQPGDIAEVEAHRSFIMGGAALVYLLPALLAIPGGVLASLMSVDLVAVGVILGFALGAMCAVLVSRRTKTDILTVTRIVSRGGKHMNNP